MPAALLRRLLAHPLSRGHDLDDPATTVLRRDIIRGKPFLRQIYQEWYDALVADIPPGPGGVLELGSGAGFFDEVLPSAILSDLFVFPNIDVVIDGHSLPLRDDSLRAIVMTNVFHHIAKPRAFLSEAARCVRPGGVLAMIEPWVTPWSKLVHTKLHHEPYRPEDPQWEFPPAGPLSGANGALPWIVFERDAEQFEREFPQWRVEGIEPLMPLRYVVSGGVSMRTLTPPLTTPLWRAIEAILPKRTFAMFAHVVVRRTDHRGPSSSGPM